MSQRLHDLLPMAEESAPPMRVTPDDILGQGRRRKRNRRAGTWVSAAAALAVAGVLVVPNLPGGGNGTAPAVDGSVTLNVAGPFRGNIATTRAAGFTINETAQVTGGYQVAPITTAEDTTRAAGLVALFRPGVFSAAAYTSGGQEVQINGKPGWFLPDATFAGGADPGPALVWEYAEDAYALVGAYPRVDLAKGGGEPQPTDTTAVQPEGPAKGGPPWMDKQQLVTVAQAVRTTATAESATVGVKLAGLPSGWALDTAGTFGETYRELEEGSFVRLVKGSPAAGDVAQLQVPVDRASVRISVAPYREMKGFEVAPGEVRCPKEDWCIRLSEDGSQLAGITAVGADGSINGAAGGMAQAELKSVLETATFADPEDRSTWFPVDPAR